MQWHADIGDTGHDSRGKGSLCYSHGLLLFVQLQSQPEVNNRNPVETAPALGVTVVFVSGKASD